MVTITLKGRITDDGRLEVELPAGLPPGDVDVVLKMVQIANDADELSVNDVPMWTEEELDAMLRPNPKTGAEIVALGHTGGWEDMEITDSVEWVKEQRRKRREKRGW
ncbi:MAG: hypothetical protein D6737_05445 [Chloroflexi bacterium]|nr:MAG: hypothetical protein D6737_05445 [Chloroflexota bacterium]